MEINIGDKVKYLSVKGPSEGVVENYDGTQAVVRLPSGKAAINDWIKRRVCAFVEGSLNP